MSEFGALCAQIGRPTESAHMPVPRRSPAAAASRAAQEEAQEAEEAAQAAALLAEAMFGTPRGKASAAATEKYTPTEQRQEPEEVEERPEEDDEAWEVECVLARRRLKPEAEGGPPGEWQYLVRWVDKPEEEDRWVPESVLDPEFLREDLEAAATERAMESARIS